MSFVLRNLVFCAAIGCAATLTLGVVSLEREIRLAGDVTASPRGSALAARPKPIRLEPVIVTAPGSSPAVALVRADNATR